MTAAALITLAALLASSVWVGLSPAPWLFPLGLALAALAPLLFISIYRARAQTALDAHPILISVASALGCVLTMVGVQRFGEDHQWTVWAALAALVIWMIWQRHQRRPRPDQTRDEPSD